MNIIRDLTGVSRIMDELDYDITKLQNKWDAERQTIIEQRNIIDTVTASIDTGQDGLFFIALAVASSGIASILFDGDRTEHSRSGLRYINCKVPFLTHINRDSKL